MHKQANVRGRRRQVQAVSWKIGLAGTGGRDVKGHLQLPASSVNMQTHLSGSKGCTSTSPALSHNYLQDMGDTLGLQVICIFFIA